VDQGHLGELHRTLHRRRWQAKKTEIAMTSGATGATLLH
jgi:hypothetical protein